MLFNNEIVPCVLNFNVEKVTEHVSFHQILP